MNEYLLSTLATPCCSRALVKAATTILGDSLRDGDLLHDFDLSLTEACANVVRHAYRACPVGPLEIRLGVEHGSHVEVRVVDQGCGFPRLPHDIRNAEPDAEGGRGLYIIKKLADAVRISSDGNRHTLYFKKNIREDLWTTCD
ncbi:MAG: ATP-binding protein [Desulfovibrionaceae bacterium]|nr:ATP-binding protein [Desulfovibrionaceae bacterium]